PRRVVPRPAPCRLTPTPTHAHLRPPAPTCGVPASTVALPGFWALRTPITQRSTVIEWRSATPGPASDEEAPDPASAEKTPGPASDEDRSKGRQPIQAVSTSPWPEAAARAAPRIRTMAAAPGSVTPLEASPT